jgi:hypothetical protein
MGSQNNVRRTEHHQDDNSSNPPWTFTAEEYLLKATEIHIRGMRFRDVEGIKEDVTAELKEASAVFKNFCFQYK